MLFAAADSDYAHAWAREVLHLCGYGFVLAVAMTFFLILVAVLYTKDFLGRCTKQAKCAPAPYVQMRIKKFVRISVALVGGFALLFIIHSQIVILQKKSKESE